LVTGPLNISGFLFYVLFSNSAGTWRSLLGFIFGIISSFLWVLFLCATLFCFVICMLGGGWAHRL
jgi:multisubunit Na+/H+ antiporter MnhE subunit